MRSLMKKRNYLTEEHFHDEWALNTPIGEINVVAQFKGTTSPEYKGAVRFLGNVKGKKILNLGCGLGEEAVYLAILGAKVYAIDISTQMLEFTRKLARRYKVGKRITYHHMSAENLKFDDNMFDGVLGCSILHHVNTVKAVKEVKRTLKPGGVAVFLEPLAYNPVINIYRTMASEVRTDHEHPLTYKDIEKIRKVFPNLIHKEFQLLTLLIFIWFFIGEQLHPNKVRYWKKIITEGNKYKKTFKLLYGIDNMLLNIVPFFRRLCWVTVMKVRKEN